MSLARKPTDEEEEWHEIVQMEPIIRGAGHHSPDCGRDPRTDCPLLGPVSEDQDNWLGTTLDTIGSSYVTLLKAAVVPLVITAIIASIGNLRKVTNAARLAVSTLLWFAFTALIAVLIGLILGVVIQPGMHADATSLSGSAPIRKAAGSDSSPDSYPSTSSGSRSAPPPMRPGGLVSEVDFNILQLIIVSGAIGIAAVKVGKAAEPFLQFTEAALAVVQKVVWWIVRIAPIGTLGLIGNAVNSYGWSTMGSLLWFVVAVYVGLAIVFFVVYPTLAKLNGLSVRQYFSGVWRPRRWASSPGHRSALCR